MSTTIVESWSGADLSQLGPIYPMVGTEMILFIIGLAFWLAFHVMQARIEQKEMEEDEAAARSSERLQRVFEAEARE
ncbi:hypothetical protein BXY70_0818 [Roseovarius halotolerans]|uniref:Heme exporter protein D n=1 Tax=Roseovarius halotolerans TaxID=505353 RepID=A0A1X6YEK0_9RHOB|nr:hypothetical protein [Roseovarius halotolerans]RKT34795.1 hypothetical protein BXY70_0818 [Roseovarius halotolerans]SLN18583.1 hypothetical protein ROH8110_00579 [Roseovarius halotolerans]